MSDQRYLVAARKYRPQLFGELVAQEHVSETLKNALRLDRLAHAYLFSGPRGVGKTTAARILAKAINCTAPLESRTEQAEPCRQCDSCRAFEEGRSLNVIEMDAASHRRVDDIRGLQETVRVPPQGARKKVYIVDEVHMLTTEAFNTLLKTLEEPPPHILFIFATTEPHKVLPTILSRCQRFDFRRISVPEIVARLEEICRAEDIRSDEASLMLIARKGDGALRDALSVFDQAVSLCGSSLDYASLAQALGVVDVDLFFDITDAVVRRDGARMLRLVERVVRSGYDLKEFLAGLAEHLRNLLVARTMDDASLIEATEIIRERYGRASGEFSEADLLRLLAIVSDAEDSIKDTTQPRLKVELALLKMATLALGADLRSALEKLARLEALVSEGRLPSEGGAGGDDNPDSDIPPSRPAPSKTEPPGGSAAAAPVQPSPTSAAPPRESTRSSRSDAAPPDRRRAELAPSTTAPTTNVLGTPALRRSGVGSPESRKARAEPSIVGDGATTYVPVASSPPQGWKDFLEDVKEDRIHVGALLQHVLPLGISGEVFTIAVPDAFHQRLLNHQHDYLVERFVATYGRSVKSLQFIIQEGLATASQEETGSDFDPYEYMQRKRQENPVIRAIFDQFGGELVW